MRFFIFLFCPFLFLASCVHEPYPRLVENGGYPENIARIMIDRCATAGCHNEVSYANSAGLRTYSWDMLFRGANSGAVIVPYDTKNSSLLHFINTDHALGHVATPTMPYNDTPLTADEYKMIRDWVAAGAPNGVGEIPFSSNAATRQKIYIAMQGCDLIGVVDAERRVIMRYIQVGRLAGPENPHAVRVSPDGKYAYVCFMAGNWLQKINTHTDQIEEELNLGKYVFNGSWNVMHLSADGKYLALTDTKGDGNMLVINTEDTMSLVAQWGGGGTFINPHGIASNPTFDTFYVTSESGNVVYKVSAKDGGLYQKVTIDNGPESHSYGGRDPHEIIFSPDYSHYFVSCQNSNEVRVLNRYTDAIVKVIDVGLRPKELDISRNPKYPYLFVTCEEEPSQKAGMKGAVYVINYQDWTIKKVLRDYFCQPHGISVDNQNGTFYVASRNADPNGPAPHHASSCGGRNGWYNIFSLETLEPVTNRRFEVSADPYSIDTRFK